ncbi:MAG: hypothetical protein JO331_09170, partial [Verrucomicrobia bacterium]|nr:hypothetical protein [Verrucomicrobiota bacterium]
PNTYPDPSQSWCIEGVPCEKQGDTPGDIAIPAASLVSCSFVEFDERGDFMDFAQHLACGEKLKNLAEVQDVLLVLYCHGWKNNSQSGDVVSFNTFLTKLALSREIRELGLRVHGVYLAWRGNSFRPYVGPSENYQWMETVFGGPIVKDIYHRQTRLGWWIPENLSYWARKLAAENRVAGLPLARAIFTYAASVKRYGEKPNNRVVIIGHSFGALLLERSLGQAMTGAITLGWSEDEKGEQSFSRRLPFDMILLVNSAAPAIYAKLLRDFLEANRRALHKNKDPQANVPVIVSITSMADWATDKFHRLGNLLSSFVPSLSRYYNKGILVNPTEPHKYPEHPPIRQSEFYITTEGHNKYLINHWIAPAHSEGVATFEMREDVFSANLSIDTRDPWTFQTVGPNGKLHSWRVTAQPPTEPNLTAEPMIPAMQHSGYWIVSCGKELIKDHNDIWSSVAMEMYAGLFRLVQSRRHGTQQLTSKAES